MESGQVCFKKDSATEFKFNVHFNPQPRSKNMPLDDDVTSGITIWRTNTKSVNFPGILIFQLQ